MKNLKNKKGISLIVLILTIIVMIIFATAIILSLNNSGIIGKANKAKANSDYASLKEYANVLKAEYELMSDAERVGYEDDIAYVNAKLEAEGYKERLNEDGVLLTEAAVYALDNNIQIGDEITGYTLDKIDDDKTYPTSGKENAEQTEQSIERIEYTTWRYIGIGENGEMLIAPDMVDTVANSQKIKLSGKGGFLSGPQELNDICKAMYSTSKGTARSMNIDDITRILDYTGDKGVYRSYSDEVWTETPKKISELEEEFNPSNWADYSTPKGTLWDYYSDDYSINKTSDKILKLASDTLKTKLTNFVYSNVDYWLASSCAYATLDDGTNYGYYGMSYVSFAVRMVNSSYVSSSYCYLAVYNEGDQISSGFSAPRPVIMLDAGVSLTNTNGTWVIS